MTQHPSDPSRNATGSPGETTAANAKGRHPSLPHEHDESSHSQARTTANQKDVGEKAYANATDGTTDTDRGPVMDKVYNDRIAPERGQGSPRQ